MSDETPRILIDTHVHIHGCFPLGRFLNAAYSNFEHAAGDCGGRQGFIGVLMLTETARADGFERLSAWVDGRAGGIGPELEAWSIRHTAETASLAAARDGQRLYIVAGRQIVAAERLEILALGFEGFVPDGEPIRGVIERVRDAGAVPVIPWGFGKWWGRRGKLVSALLRDQAALGFFLGDNSGRTTWLGRPAPFEDAYRNDIPILPGTDPLPFPAEYGRVGSFGLAMHEPFDPARPAAEIKRLLKSTPPPLMKPYGSCETPLRFLRNQVAMQLYKHGVA